MGTQVARERRAAGFMLMLVVSLVAGCASPTSEADGPRLADFESCQFVYPRLTNLAGKPIPCANQFVSASPMDSVPAGWTCVAKPAQAPVWWRLYRENLGSLPLPGGGLAFWYDLSSFTREPFVLGIRMSWANQIYYNWSATQPVGFVHLRDTEGKPELRTVDFWAEVYTTRYEFPRNGSHDGVLEPLWSAASASEFWMLLRLKANGTDYYFQSYNETGTNDPSYDLAPLHVQGADFEFSFQPTIVHREMVMHAYIYLPENC